MTQKEMQEFEQKLLAHGYRRWRVEKAMTCKWLRNGNECGKGLPGTLCEVVGCVAWEHYEEIKK